MYAPLFLYCSYKEAYFLKAVIIYQTQSLVSPLQDNKRNTSSNIYVDVLGNSISIS